MGAHMKTTIEIADPLLTEAKRLAAKQGVTLRALVELGIHKVIEEAKTGDAFELRDGSFGGNGLQPAMTGEGWDRIRELAYEGRGG